MRYFAHSLRLGAALFLLGASACKRSSPEASSPPSQAASQDPLVDHVRYVAPEGWEKRVDELGADYAIHFKSEGIYEIRLQLLGGPGSLYQDPAAFLQGLRTAKKTWDLHIWGKPVPSYARSYQLEDYDPHGVDAPRIRYFRDDIWLVPMGRRFLALSYSVSGPTPKLPERRHPAWSIFIKNFSIIRDY